MNRLPGIHSTTGARRSRIRNAALTMAAASMILVACGTGGGEDVPEDRQFANDPAPTREATETPVETPTQPAQDEPPGDVEATPADLLRTRGAPSTLYTVVDGRLLTLQMQDGIGQQEIVLLQGSRVLGVAASPTGDRVGVVTADASGAVHVSFFNAEGEPLGGPYDTASSGTPGASPVASPGATPVGTPGASPAASEEVSAVPVSWAPQGNGVLLVDRNTLVYVDVERGAETISTRGVPGTILAAWASPTGGQILLHVAEDDGSHGAYLIQRDSGEVNELWAMRTEPGLGLAELAWLPTGNGVVFVRGELVDGEVLRGQLFSYGFRSEFPELIATSGQGGPSATIRNVAVSPDGRSVAYTVAIFDVDHWSLHSMWVRSMKHAGQGIQLPVESGHTINSMAWSREGLVWTYTARYGTEGTFVGLIKPDGSDVEIAPLGVPSATPPATPVTSASPVATPGATPLGSPVATPVG